MAKARKTSQQMVKVVFDLPDRDEHGISTESVWAEMLPGNRCRILNIPFFAEGVSYGDIVFVRKRDGFLVYEETSIAAGHSTYRMLIDSDLSKSDLEACMAPFKALGCGFEGGAFGGAKRLLAIDAPPWTDVQEVRQLLKEGAQTDRWAFEESHRGHTT